jgi:hypothetical protein
VEFGARDVGGELDDEISAFVVGETEDSHGVAFAHVKALAPRDRVHASDQVHRLRIGFDCGVVLLLASGLQRRAMAMNDALQGLSPSIRFFMLAGSAS